MKIVIICNYDYRTPSPKLKNVARFLYNGDYSVVADENGLYCMCAGYYNSDNKIGFRILK